MNRIRIEEGIVTKIQSSHRFGDIQYDMMDVIVKNSNGKESLLTLKYKHYDNKFYDIGSRVNCTGILRSYSEKVEGKNKVSIYVSTDFSSDDSVFKPDITLYPSSVIIDGSICSMEPLRDLSSGKCNIHFILANNTEIQFEESGVVKSYNSYIPCIAWGKLAKKIAEHNIGDKLLIDDGELRSREYVKHLLETDEIRLCHELYIKSYKDITE